MLQGYLGDVLAQQCGLVVVGLEREVDRVKAARTRNLTRVKPATRSQAQALKNTLSTDGEESCHINTDERKVRIIMSLWPPNRHWACV